MTQHDWQDFKVARVALVKLGTVRMRALCDAVENAATAVTEAANAGTMLDTRTAQDRAVELSASAKRKQYRGITDDLVAYVRQAPRTFAEIRAAFPKMTSNQLSQALNHAKQRGLVSKRSRGRDVPWRARKSA